MSKHAGFPCSLLLWVIYELVTYLTTIYTRQSEFRVGWILEEIKGQIFKSLQWWKSMKGCGSGTQALGCQKLTHLGKGEKCSMKRRKIFNNVWVKTVSALTFFFPALQGCKFFQPVLHTHTLEIKRKTEYRNLAKHTERHGQFWIWPSYIREPQNQSLMLALEDYYMEELSKIAYEIILTLLWSEC